MNQYSTIFLVSDRTGITVEGLLRTLLTQFEQVTADHVVRPFCDTPEKMARVLEEIATVAERDNAQPLVFSSIADPELRVRLKTAKGQLFDIFDVFLPAISRTLHQKSSTRIGQAHGMGDHAEYDRRVEAVNFALTFDDGSRLKGLEDADLILIGVSRSGKTPTCLYLAMQYRILAANYPLTEDDFLQGRLPEPLRPFRDRLFGLRISPERLHQIREERRPGSHYASLARCRNEVGAAEHLFRLEEIPNIDSTNLSIEELAVEILQQEGVDRLR